MDGRTGGRTGGRMGARTGAQADERCERTTGLADERTGVGTSGGRADGGGQWADGRTGAGVRADERMGRRGGGLAD